MSRRKCIKHSLIKSNRNYSAILATLQICYLQGSENGRVVTIGLRDDFSLNSGLLIRRAVNVLHTTCLTIARYISMLYHMTARHKVKLEQDERSYCNQIGTEHVQIVLL